MSDEIEKWIRDQAPDASEEVVRGLAQDVRELAPEASNEEEFLAALGFGICEKCGRKGLDDDYTDCELIPDPKDPHGPGLLLCHDCVTPDEANRLWSEWSDS